MPRTAARMGAGALCPFIFVAAANAECERRLVLTLDAPTPVTAVRALAQRAGVAPTRLRPITAQVWTMGVRGTCEGSAPLEALRTQPGVRAAEWDARRAASAR